MSLHIIETEVIVSHSTDVSGTTLQLFVSPLERESLLFYVPETHSAFY